MKEYIASFANVWDERGVTIMCDGWTGPTKMHIINFLVYSNRGTVFHKSIDATDVTSRNADYYFSLMKKVVEEVGPSRVIQVVTDNEAAMKAVGKKLMEEFPNLYWTACAAHCIDLMLEDIAKKTSIKDVLDNAKLISGFIYNSTWCVNYMKKFTNGREILRTGITRFATNFVSLESIVKHRLALRDMFESPGWMTSRWGQMTQSSATKVRELVLANTEDGVKFWKEAAGILKVMEPLLRVLMLVDGDEKLTMGFIYEAMERAKLAIKRDCRYYKTYGKIIDNRWNIQLHHDLHAAGYFFNPQFCYSNDKIFDDEEVMSGVKKVIRRIEPNMDNAIKALNQLFIYKDKSDSFGNDMALTAIKHMNPTDWWVTFGESVPQLRRIAIRVLSQTTSSSNCERNWSVWSQVHTKARNRLQYKRLHMIVYLRYNMKLKIRHATRRSQQEIDSGFDPINLDYIFEDDPLNSWVEEREEPVFDGDDLEWMNFGEDEDNNTIQIDDVDPAIRLGSSPPINYSTMQRSTSPSNNNGGNNGFGHEDGDTTGYVNTYEDFDRSSPHVRDLDDQVTQRRQIPTQTFSRRRRSNDQMDHDGLDDNSSYSSNTVQGNIFHNIYPTPHWGDVGDAITQPQMPSPHYPPGPYQQQQTWENTWNWNTSNESNSFEGQTGAQYRDHIQILNHGTINYGAVHYDHSTNYGVQPYGMENMGSYIFDDPVRDDNNDNNDAPPAIHFGGDLLKVVCNL